MVLTFATACKKESDGGAGGGGGGGDVVRDPGKEDINVWSFTNEIPDATRRYQEIFPDSAVTKNFNIIPNVTGDDDGAYELGLETALRAGGKSAPDIWTAEQAYVLKFSQGGFASFAATYEELGIADVAGKIASARIAQYGVDAGTRDGKVVALRFQETGACLIYRRDIAEEVFGTQDPAAVGKIVGPGWDKFFDAAEQLKEAGYAIVYGAGDVWGVARDGAKQPWVVGGKLYIDPARMEFFDLAKRLFDGGYIIGGGQWGDGWFGAMSGNSDPEVFSFLGPAWLINYVMVNNMGDTAGNWAVTGSPVGWSWGGTWVFGNKDLSGDKKAAVAELIEWITLDTSDKGFQYFFANGNLYEDSKLFPDEAAKFASGNFAKDAVASAAVMDKADGTLAILGGQDMFDFFLPAGAGASSAAWHELDRSINGQFQDLVNMYINGEISKDDAIAQFKTWINEEHGIDVD